LCSPERKLKLLQKRVTRKRIGSNNWKMAAEKVALLHDINSGNTVRDGPLGVGSRPLGNVELLTLTLSFPCNWKS
jgi:hypothetical protein